MEGKQRWPATLEDVASWHDMRARNFGDATTKTFHEACAALVRGLDGDAMTPDAFMLSVRRTEQMDLGAIAVRLGNVDTIRLLHAAIGLSTESGELQDQVKRHLFYGKPLDRVNLIEEVGDVLWYAAVALMAVGSSFEVAMQANAAKLQKRYAAGFSETEAVGRDLGAERQALEEHAAIPL